MKSEFRAKGSEDEMRGIYAPESLRASTEFPECLVGFSIQRDHTKSRFRLAFGDVNCAVDEINVLPLQCSKFTFPSGCVDCKHGGKVSSLPLGFLCGEVE